MVILVNYFCALILYCIYQFKGERSIKAVQYLLTGKKSTQTLQDAVWYSLQHLYSVYPEMDADAFIDTVKKLEKTGSIVISDKTVALTESGKKVLSELMSGYTVPDHLNGWQFHKMEQFFWQRLTLLIQILTNWAYSETKFIPVVRDYPIQNWVKRWLGEKQQIYNKKQLSLCLYNELFSIFEICEQNRENPDYIVARFTGYQRPGYTSTQIAKQAAVDETYYILAFRSCLHFMIQTIWHKRGEFPILSSLLVDRKSPWTLTSSSWETYKFLKYGKNVEEIAKFRKLKKSTIEDHIVEIALLDPSFSIDTYVKPDTQKRITEAVNLLQTRKLKTIKDYLTDIDYFSIRLVLSKMNDKNDV